MSFGEDLRNFFHTNFNFRSTLFRSHQSRELERYRDFFDTVERQPLTGRQRRSVILDEHRNLVVAGAGTGKTSVIVAKAGYLVKSGKCRPDEILLLAFNADAADELAARCKDRLGIEIRASTFHALGNHVIGTVEPVVPTVSRLVLDRQYFAEFFETVVEKLLADKDAWKRARAVVLGHLKPYKSEFEFRKAEDQAAYIRGVELRALSGDLVKSFAELDIANFLFINGVNFEYEKRYPYGRERYQPDFHLTDYGIWIEHFGVDRKGNTAPYVDRDAYARAMAWKRDIHAKNRTILLETYSWQKSEGNLAKRLHELLKKNGVTYAPRPDAEIFKALRDTKYIPQLASLTEKFLVHFKSNQISQSDLFRKAKRSSNPRRATAFAEFFRFFLEKYESELDGKRPREIDFNDMILAAASHIRSGRFAVPWKYIIVDEFQDISVGRYRLLDAMLKSRGDLQFFAVGDDWQSIYRFAGSDISIMSRFRKFFGRATIVKLDRTFRFNDRIASVSAKFIQRNPRQIRKKLSTHIERSSPQVMLHWVSPAAGGRRPEIPALKGVVHGLTADLRERNPTLLVLSRYNHLLPDRAQLREIESIWPGQMLDPLTVHRAKGLEADYVIVNGLSAGRFGFPSEVEDDPLLDLVLARPDSYPNAEERRLFYVALTRARQQVHLIVDRIHPSPFALELLNGRYDINHVGRDEKPRGLTLRGLFGRS